MFFLGPYAETWVTALLIRTGDGGGGASAMSGSWGETGVVIIALKERKQVNGVLARRVENGVFTIASYFFWESRLCGKGLTSLQEREIFPNK